MSTWIQQSHGHAFAAGAWQSSIIGVVLTFALRVRMFEASLDTSYVWLAQVADNSFNLVDSFKYPGVWWCSVDSCSSTKHFHDHKGLSIQQLVSRHLRTLMTAAFGY